MQPGVAPLVWPECKPDQIQVLIFGIFPFSQSRQIDVLTSGRQEQLGETLARLELRLRRGLATEVGVALIRFGLEDLGLRRLFATAHLRNVASIRVMEKLGMKRITVSGGEAEFECAPGTGGQRPVRVT